MSNRKKPAAVLEENEPVVKVVKQISILEADTMSSLEEKVNEFLPKLSYNDLTEPAVTLYHFDRFYAKMEFDVKMRPQK